MPGKKDSEYFPLNLNVNVVYDFEPSSYHSLNKYESLEDGDDITTDDEDHEMNTTVSDVLRSRSGSNTSRTHRIRNVSLNMTQNSDDEGEGSMQSSSDLDIDGEEGEVDEVEMMDTLVLSIREKLRMSTSATIWTTSESTPPSTPYDSSVSSNTFSHLRRRRLQHSYSQVKARNPLTSVQKKGHTTTKSYWAHHNRGKSAPDSPCETPYEVLQELLQSGSLIKEAVRRLSTTKRRNLPGNTLTASLPITAPNSCNPPSVIHLSPPK